MTICTRCIFSNDNFKIEFDNEGVCEVCNQVSHMEQVYGTGREKGAALFDEIVSEIKNAGKSKQYDCVVGVSGGVDSSYLLLLAKQRGLRPLAVHYDNTWNRAVATQNILAITNSLGVDLYTHVVDGKEHDAIKLAYLKAGVREFDTDTDLGYVQVLRMAAAKYKVKYILEGHSFMEEGISPPSDNYFDGGYIADIIKRFSKQKIKTYPLMSFWQFLKWILIYKQKFIRPLWYVKYEKSEAREILQSQTSWKYYGGHHLENRASQFGHTVWLPQKFKLDYRILTISAQVRNGRLSPHEGLQKMQEKIIIEDELKSYICKRLEITEGELENFLSPGGRNWREFKTYKKRFERLRPLFYLFAKANMVPMSFYLKYCFPIENKK